MVFQTPSCVATPATLKDYTRSSLIVPQLQQRDTAGVVSELSRVLQREGYVPDVLPFYHLALNRELLSNSALDCGMAFPHARLSGVKQLQFALGRAPEPIRWGAKGVCLVKLVFLIAVPATDAVRYLHLLASLARLSHQPELLERIQASECAESMLKVLEGIHLRQD
jgi:mannitol/fructose-specific phosphotransferase system IIA component (Ntr-type)